MLNEAERLKLIQDYTPVLVLYLEINTEQTRDENWNEGFRTNGEPPLSMDYHPRNVRMVLENCALHQRFTWLPSWLRRKPDLTTSDWRDMLEKMQRTLYKRHLNVFPEIALDDEKEFWKGYAKIDKDSNPDYARACYARTRYNSRGTELIVQYWYAYLYNDFWNKHEMDWEAVTVLFDVDGQEAKPRLCAASAHARGHKLNWDEMEKSDGQAQLDGSGTHPVIYVAHGSHAGYMHGPGRFFTASEFVRGAARKFGRTERPLIDFTTTFGEDTAFLVEAGAMPEDDRGWHGEWRWLNHKGRWGSPGDYDLEFGDSGPRGPKYAMLKWTDPFRWISVVCETAEQPE